MKLNAILIFCLFTVVVKAQSPVQDCKTAIPVCQAVMPINRINFGFGFGSNEVNLSNSCLASGEVQSTWFKTKVLSGGRFGFNIFSPNPSSDSDYDWSVFKLNNASCTDIYSNPQLEVACNFSGSTFPYNITGLNDGSNPQDDQMINVLAGDELYIIVNAFRFVDTTFTIDFSNSTCTLDYSNENAFNQILVPMFFPPFDIDVPFSTYIDFNSVSPTDFTLTNINSGFQPVISDIQPNYGNGPGDTTACLFRFSVFPQLSQTAQYELTLTGTITDLCNRDYSGDNLSFTPLATDINENEIKVFSINTVTKDNLTINFVQPSSANIQLTDISGRLIQSLNVNKASSYSINTTGLSAGVYVLSIATDSAVQSAKFIKTDY